MLTKDLCWWGYPDGQVSVLTEDGEYFEQLK